MNPLSKYKKMNPYTKKRLLVSLIAVTVIIIFSVLLELFAFNFQYWKLSDTERGNHPIEVNELLLRDLSFENGQFIVTGNNPSFQIPGNRHIAYLTVHQGDGTESFQLSIVSSDGQQRQSGKKYDVDRNYKSVSVLYVSAAADEVYFVPHLHEGVFSFSLESLSVNNVFVFNKFRVFGLASFLLSLFFILYFRKTVAKKLHVSFLVIVILIGTNIAILTPTYYSYDEREHFVRAYEVSCFDLEIGAPKEIQWVDNIDSFFRFTGFSNQPHNTILEKNNYFHEFSSTDYSKSAYYNSTAISYPFVPYLVSGFGIFSARILGLPFIYTFFAGRLFSLFGYAIIGALCIKHVSIAKRSMFMVGLLPTFLFVSSAYSADTFTLAFSFAAVTVFLNMLAAKSHSLSYKQPLLFTVYIAIVIMCKVTYAPLCLLIFCIPKERFQKNTQSKFFKLGALSFCGIIALLTYLFANIKDINQWQQPGVDVSGQISFILHHIPTYIEIMWNCFTSDITNYFNEITITFAYCPKLSNIWMPVLIVALFTITIIDHESDVLSLKKKDKGIIFLAITASWALVMTALYITFTSVANNGIIGIQGRYLMPLLLPCLLLFKNKSVVYQRNADRLNYGLAIGFSIPLWLLVQQLFVTYHL